MKTIKINDFPMPEDAKTICDLQNEFYGYPLGERFYMAYETDPNPEKPFSVLWNDLKWLSKFYGVTHFDENCDITDQSLNDGRDHNIARNKDMIKRNIVWYDYDRVKENGMINYEDKYGNPTTITLTNKDGHSYKASEREPAKLTKGQKEYLQKDIAKGRYIICRYVRK